MNANARKLREYLLSFYEADEWPTLLSQAAEWAETEPLRGLKILDSTPVYRNTMAQYMALLAAGAEVFVPRRQALPFDENVMAALPGFGIEVLENKRDDFDVILDCAGLHSGLRPTLGVSELTRSGAYRYERSMRPVFLADAGRIKKIETVLGTGESFFRALDGLGYDSWEGKKLLVVGYGKVGSGIVLYALRHGMRVTVADIADKRDTLPDGVRFLPMSAREEFKSSVAEELTREAISSWCVVTATGHWHALRHAMDAAAVCRSEALLANMGVEDEFGPSYPAERLLNGKKPLNFMLSEPTSMRFIETTMALHNAGALELLIPDLPPGIMEPPVDVEERLLSAARRGRLAADLAVLGGC